MNEIKEKTEGNNKISWYSKSIYPFLIFAAILSLCQASLIQSIGFYITDLFGDLDNLPTLISMTFALLSISTIVSQNMFTSMFNLNNYKLSQNNNLGSLNLKIASTTLFSFLTPEHHEHNDDGGDHDHYEDNEKLINATRSLIAGYKLPKQIIFVDEVQRAPNGKANYKWAKNIANENQI